MTDQTQTVPTQSEEAVLGSLMIDPSTFAKIDLSPEDFAIEKHRAIYRAIQALAKNGRPIDVVTVSETMGNASLASKCASLASETATAANAVAYAQNVKKAAQLREANRIAQCLPAALEKHGSIAIERAALALLKLGIDEKEWEFDMHGALCEALSFIDERAESGGKIKIPTGLTDLDAQLGGWHPPDLTIIGARPAIGKTAFLLNLAHHCGVPCGLITAEQPRQQIGLRYLSMEAEVSLEKMRVAKLGQEDYQRVSDSLRELSNHEVYGYDKPGPTLTDIIRQSRRWRYEHGIEILFVDYLQLIRADNERQQRNHQIASISAGLKTIARTLNIPVVCLAQLNRDLEKRPDKRPVMADLRDAGEIEQDADQILMLYRDEVYDANTAEPGVMEINIVKNKHGQTGMVKATWIAEYLRVVDIAPPWANYEAAGNA